MASFVWALWCHRRGQILRLGIEARSPRERRSTRASSATHGGILRHAPALNPVAPRWTDVKGHTATSLRRARRELRRQLQANTCRVRRSHAKRRSFIWAAKWPSPP
jgi:hypothetical protein